MNRYRAYWPLDDAPLKDGDGGFVGVDERMDPDLVKPGFVSSATNCRFRNGLVEPRPGITILPWMKADGRTPFTTTGAMTVFKVSPPAAYTDYIGTANPFAPNGVNDCLIGVRFGEVENILGAEVRLDGSTTNRWWSYNNTYYPVGFIVNGVLAATNWSTALNLSAQEVVLAIDLASMAGNVVGNHYYEVRVTCTSGVKTGFVTFLT